MKFFFHINLIFLISILTSKTFAQNQIVADLSQENVKISTDFQGAKILLFGAYDGKKGDDIIVIVTGPKGLVTVQKKEKILGVWVNTKKVNYINTPKYLSISSNRRIDDILNKKTQKISEIGLNNLKIRIQPGIKVENEGNWRQALTRNMLKSNLWSINENSVSLNKDSLFRSYLELPSNVITGQFEVKILHYRNSKLVSQQINSINVSKKSRSLTSLFEVHPPTFQWVDNVEVVAPWGYTTTRLFKSAIDS